MSQRYVFHIIFRRENEALPGVVKRQHHAAVPEYVGYCMDVCSVLRACDGAGPDVDLDNVSVFGPDPDQKSSILPLQGWPEFHAGDLDILCPDIFGINGVNGTIRHGHIVYLYMVVVSNNNSGPGNTSVTRE